MIGNVDVDDGDEQSQRENKNSIVTALLEVKEIAKQNVSE